MGYPNCHYVFSPLFSFVLGKQTVRIPLDYYRILGVPIQATDQQLSQAYRDRSLQLPRREYSDAAIDARKQLLDEAYSVLSDPEQRAEYDASFLAKTYEEANPSNAELSLEKSERLDAGDRSVTPYSSWIEIDEVQFAGALLILQELGEYELVLKLGQPFINTHKGNNTEPNDAEGVQMLRADIVLTVALACLELGREQWQQGQSESAALSGKMGQELLLQEGLFPNIRGEIQADLYKLRPYQVLELLALSETESLQRRRGLQILRNMLDERGGIDGSGDDRSGLSVDDFLRFIQQLRNYLTAAEQQELFEAEALRPSAVATYLAVYSLIARGFAERQPAAISKTQELLARLSKRQDVYLEQAVCALLLGQTEEASAALELSQEYEPLAFIREHSQDSPDLLPGLCLYGERWLQSEVFPHFRDLAVLRASLKDYFADEQVQAYLEQLPVESASEAQKQWSVVEPQNVATAERMPEDASALPVLAEPLAASSVESVPPADRAASVARAGTATMERSPATSDVATLPKAATVPAALPSYSGSNTSVGRKTNRRRDRRSRRTRAQALDASLGTPQSNGRSIGARERSQSVSKWGRLLLLLLGGVLGIGVLGFAIVGTFNWVRQALQNSSAAKLAEGQPNISLAQPPLEIPAPNAPIVIPGGPLAEEGARQIVVTWLSVKSKAFGNKYEVEQLDSILAEPTLLTWRARVRKLKQNNSYREFDHKVTIESVNTSSDNPDAATIEAAVRETAKVYNNGTLDQLASYDENLRVRYNVVREDKQWWIQRMQVIE